jgi:hypothetical protein
VRRILSRYFKHAGQTDQQSSRGTRRGARGARARLS